MLEYLVLYLSIDGKKGPITSFRKQLSGHLIALKATQLKSIAGGKPILACSFIVMCQLNLEIVKETVIYPISP